MENLPLMQSPLQPFIITVLYLLVVLRLGPNLMKNRRPYTLKTTIIVYNVTQIIINAVIFIKIAKLASQTKILCGAVDESDLKLFPETLVLHYSYLLLKIYDFSETIFFVLRKKQRQISFLHLFHHVFTFLLAWICGKYFPASETLPTGPVIVLIGFNTFVHSFMYTYYLLSAIDVAGNIWWKQYITVLQMTQHVVFVVLSIMAFVSPDCPYPKNVVAWSGLFFVSQIYLFGSFFYKNYVAKK